MPRILVLLAFLALSTPLFPAGRELAPRGGGPTSYGVANPNVGFANDRFLTVWTEPMENMGHHLMGAFSDTRGRRISTLSFPIIQSFRGSPLQLVGTGHSYALFWNDTLNQTHLTDIDRDGRVTRTQKLPMPWHLGFHASWNGSRFLVALYLPVSETYHAEALVFERDGTLVRRGIPIDNNAYGFDSVTADDGFTLVTTGRDGVHAYRVTNDGDLTDHPIEGVMGTSRLGTPAAALTPDGDALLVWSVSTDLRTDIKSCVLSRAGTVTEVRTIFEANASWTRALELARIGNDYVFVFDARATDNTTTRLETMTFRADGMVLVPPTPVPADPGSSLGPDAAASSEAILVAFSPSPLLPVRIDSVAVRGEQTQEVLSMSRTRQTQPALAVGGGRYLSAWTDIAGAAAFVRAVSIATDGEPLTDEIVGPAYTSARELSWNGTEYLSVQLRYDQLLARRVAYDGKPIDLEPIVLGQFATTWWSVSTSVAWIGDRWAVTWVTSDAIRFATVSRSGVVSLSRAIPLAAPIEPGWFPLYESAALSWNGTTLLLVWTEEQMPPCFFPGSCEWSSPRTFAVRLNANGDVRDVAPLELPAAASLSMATSGKEFLLLGGMTAYAIDASAAPRVISSQQVFNWNALGDITWDGTSYAVALRYKGLRWYLSVVRLDRDARIIGARRGTETLPPDFFLAPSIAAIDSSSAMIAVQEGDAKDGARAVLYAERNMAALPAPPSPPRNVRLRDIGFGKFEVTWEASRDGEVEVYRITGAEGGGVAPDQPLRAISWTADVRVIAFNAGGASEPIAPSLVKKRRATRP